MIPKDISTFNDSLANFILLSSLKFSLLLDVYGDGYD